MRHWLDNLACAFGPDAAITLTVDTMRSVTIRVTVERKGSIYEIAKQATWREIELSAVDPLAMVAEQIISEWRSSAP